MSFLKQIIIKHCICMRAQCDGGVGVFVLAHHAEYGK